MPAETTFLLRLRAAAVSLAMLTGLGACSLRETGGGGSSDDEDSSSSQGESGTGGSSGDTGGSLGTGEGEDLLCVGDGLGGWAQEPGIGTPEYRGVGEDDEKCQAVTEDTVELQLRLMVPGEVELGTMAEAGLLVFEYDSNWADSSAWCLLTRCNTADDGEFEWTIEVPNDLENMDYYIVARIADGDTRLIDDGFSKFSAEQGVFEVPMRLLD